MLTNKWVRRQGRMRRHNDYNTSNMPRCRGKAKGAALVVTSHHVPLAKIVGLPALQNTEQQSLLKIAGIRWNGKKPVVHRKAPKLVGKTAAERVLEDRR